jgi:hypothetical protein
VKEEPEDREQVPGETDQAPEETEQDAALPAFKIPKRDVVRDTMAPATPALSLFEWEPNVMADVDSKCVPTHPFIYITKVSGSETTKYARDSHCSLLSEN